MPGLHQIVHRSVTVGCHKNWQIYQAIPDIFTDGLSKIAADPKFDSTIAANTNRNSRSALPEQLGTFQSERQ